MDVLDPEVVAGFVQAVFRDKPIAERLLLDCPELRQARLALGESILHFFAIEGTASEVEWLICQGFDVNSSNSFNHPVIVESLLAGRIEVADLLVKAGANLVFNDETYGNIADLEHWVDDLRTKQFIRQLITDNRLQMLKPRFAFTWDIGS